MGPGVLPVIKIRNTACTTDGSKGPSDDQSITELPHHKPTSESPLESRARVSSWPNPEGRAQKSENKIKLVKIMIK